MTNFISTNRKGGDFVSPFLLVEIKRRGEISLTIMFNPNLWKNKSYYIDLKHKDMTDAFLTGIISLKFK